jgi:HEAT repeat protein
MGHLYNFAGVPLIAGFGTHPTSDIRYAVAFALGCFPNEPLSITTLLKLIDDTDEDVRDWATFGLGNLGDADSPEIRVALVRRLYDSKEDVREEAMVGLGKRKDPCVLTALLGALEQPDLTGMAIEAAYLMLGMAEEREGWTAADYAAALRTQFSM